MDNGGGRSFSKNERTSRSTTNGNRTNQRRNPDNVSRSLKGKYKYSINGRNKQDTAKWAIKLGEHEIEFRGRNSVKGHILADFLAETPSMGDREINDEEAKRKEPEPENAWKLFTDRASSSDGSGVGLILVSPEGKEYTYALRFEFKTVGIKRLQDILRVTAAQLQLLSHYYCWKDYADRDEIKDLSEKRYRLIGEQR
ncbi:hypothetical protein Tco_0707078 [Tanacetum coccineum]|uniref:Uncharacterized protein n=1 Tax=Tanacetum coccineum TaxID=301880 RepID=A0ABQ4YA36_9ASTR